VLKQLRIRNLAVIEEVTLEFESGFTAVTGETGAGKSMLIDGLNLVLGERADKELVRTGCDEAQVEALFDISDEHRVAALLSGLELPSMEDDLLLRRVVSAAGRSRCAVNGSPVPLLIMKQLGDLLVDLHGQHEHQLLFDESRHLEFLDAFGRLEDLRSDTAAAYLEWKSVRDDLDSLGRGGEDKARRMELLLFQVNEIDSAKLVAGEEEGLAEEKKKLANARRIEEALTRAREGLTGERGAQEMMGGAAAALRTVLEFDRGGIGPILERLKGLEEGVREGSNELRVLLEMLEADPARLEWLEERLDTIARLKHKYGGSPEKVHEHLAAARAELKMLSGAEERVAELKERLGKLSTALSALAAKLSLERSGASMDFAKSVARQLEELAMEKADFGVRTTQYADEAGPVTMDGSTYKCTQDGIDTVEFYLAPNVGEETKPLKSIASGGEMSRVMLAIKSVLAGADRVGTMVFDEIDAGIGGRVAEVVGRKLAGLGDRRQVICITHLPQIAARASRQVSVTKDEGEGHARVRAVPVTGQARVAEIARMLAGEEITASALKHAKALLEGAS
jgi:DNA repair protein RecN (Recombination protein N)